MLEFLKFGQVFLDDAATRPLLILSSASLVALLGAGLLHFLSGKREADHG